MIYENSEIELSDANIVVSYFSFEFDKYSIVEEKGFLYLQGENAENLNSDRFGKLAISDSYDIFFELLALHKSLEICGEKRARPFRLQNINNGISESDLSHILAFVQKYGFPYFNTSGSSVFSNFFPGDEEISDQAVKNILSEIPRFCEAAAFPVSEFVYWLDRIIKVDFISVLAKYEKLAEQLEVVLFDHEKKMLSERKNLSTQSPYLLNLHFPYYNDFTMRFDNKLCALEVHTENIMHLAAYYICLIASTGNIGGTGRIIACRGCGKLFIPENPRSRYCRNPCTRQNIFMKKKRSK